MWMDVWLGRKIFDDTRFVSHTDCLSIRNQIDRDLSLLTNSGNWFWLQFAPEFSICSLVWLKTFLEIILKSWHDVMSDASYSWDFTLSHFKNVRVKELLTSYWRLECIRIRLVTQVNLDCAFTASPSQPPPLFSCKELQKYETN